MEVRALSLLFMKYVCLIPRFSVSLRDALHTLSMIQSDDISRTAKFMSSPLVQSLASSRPVQVSTKFLVLTLFLGFASAPRSNYFTHTNVFFWLTQTYLQHLTNQTVTRNALDDKPNAILEVCSHASMSSYKMHTLYLFIDRASSICTSAGVQQRIVIISTRRAYSRTTRCIPVVSVRREAGVDPSCACAHLCFLGFRQIDVFRF